MRGRRPSSFSAFLQSQSGRQSRAALAHQEIMQDLPPTWSIPAMRALLLLGLDLDLDPLFRNVP